MQIADAVKHVIATRHLPIDLNVEYSQDQLDSIYIAIIQNLDSELGKGLSIDVAEDDVISSEEIVQFKQQLSAILTSQTQSDILDFYTANYLNSLEPIRSRIVCEVLVQHAYTKHIPISSMWNDVIANDGTVPKVYLD